MRRRFLRRVGGPMRGMLRAGIPPLLLHSNELLAAGEFAGAAVGLEQLARAAEGRGGRRAPQLYLEAGRARILGGDTDAGMALLDQGLRLMAASGAALRLARAGRRIMAELSARGLNGEADQVRSSLAILGAPTLDGTPGRDSTEPRRVLPIHCPGCGAPVHPDEVEWLDSVTAECEYCGTPMRPE